MPPPASRGAIAIHDTTLGPALGGLRIWPHATEQDAIMDVLRLSEAMTLKSAAAGLDLGGGKAIIMRNAARDKTEALLRSFGTKVDSLNGKYITTEDVGTTTADMQWVARETNYVTGLASESGGSGDPSPMTSYGLYQGLLATAQYLWGSDDLSGMRVVLMGLGKVGNYLLPYLKGRGRRHLWNGPRPGSGGASTEPISASFPSARMKCSTSSATSLFRAHSAEY